MNLKTGSIFLVLPIVLFSCEVKNQELAPEQNLLIGSWISPVAADSIISYRSSDSLLTQEYGFTFNADQTFIERKNAGWCGTPPVYHSDFEGIWTREDSMIYIQVGYWGGTVDYEWKIVSLDNERLEIIQMKVDYKDENRYYFSEIFDEAYLDIYGEWELKSVSGGIHGGGHELNFETLKIEKIGQYRFTRDGNTIERGKIILEEQSSETLRISMEADAGSDVFMYDSEKFVSLSGKDTLDLFAPCCDRFNYHYVRKQE
jgi:hypothetical protein